MALWQRRRRQKKQLAEFRRISTKQIQPPVLCYSSPHLLWLAVRANSTDRSFPVFPWHKHTPTHTHKKGGTVGVVLHLKSCILSKNSLSYYSSSIFFFSAPPTPPNQTPAPQLVENSFCVVAHIPTSVILHRLCFLPGFALHPSVSFLSRGSVLPPRPPFSKQQPPLLSNRLRRCGRHRHLLKDRLVKRTHARNSGTKHLTNSVCNLPSVAKFIRSYKFSGNEVLCILSFSSSCKVWGGIIYLA